MPKKQAFHKLLPNKILTFKDEVYTSDKLSKNRITMMIDTDMDGSEMLTLLIIGKLTKPRYFKGVKTRSIGYVANGKS